MSSCFLCDTSYQFDYDRRTGTSDDRYTVVYAQGRSEKHFIKYMPIMVGSSGTNTNDQQHTNGNTQNYVSYRVKRIEFRFSTAQIQDFVETKIPVYVIIFKIPFREIIFDYYFTTMNNFILYSEPETILTYGVYQQRRILNSMGSDSHVLNVNKPFIVGPNDYVGVLYFFSDVVYIHSSAKVWFDVV